MKLNKKEKESLWSVIDGSIMDARIKIQELDTGNNYVCCHTIITAIDAILFNTSLDCNQKVIQLIKQIK